MYYFHIDKMHGKREKIMQYLLSIIVPTKNRYIYLKSIVKIFSDMDNNEIELVIQDNSEDNKEILQFLGDDYSKNIKYFSNRQHMTVSDNFNEGILNSSGAYVCMLGDDDIISSKIIEIVKYMKINDIESAIFNKASYTWPDMEFKVHKLPSLCINRITGKIETVDSQTELMKCLIMGATSLLKLPEVYQGIVKRTSLDKIYYKGNTYFPGSSPDMAIAIALSLVVKSHIYVDIPYIISGQAYVSAGGKGARHEHKGRLKDMDWLPIDIEDKWEKKIPMVWTGSTIYADSAHKAINYMGREELLKKFNYPYQYAYFLSFNPEYREYLKPLIKGKHVMKIKIIIYMIRIFFLRSIIFIKNILTTRFGITNTTIFEDVKTSGKASKIVDDFIEKQLKNL